MKCGGPLEGERRFVCEACDDDVTRKVSMRTAWDHESAADDLIRRSGVPRVYATGGRRLADVRDERAVRAAERVLAGELPGLYIHGEAGPDKTTLAAALLVQWTRAGETCACASPRIGECKLRGARFVPMIELKTDVLASYADGAELTRATIVNSLTAPSLLVLDDFDKAGDSAHTVEVIYQVLDQRYRQLDARLRRPLVITTNYPLDALCERWSRALRREEAAGLIDPVRRRIEELTATLPMGAARK